MHSSEAVVHRSVNGTVCYDILGFLSMMNFATDLILPLADSVLSTLYTFRPCSSMMWRIILLRCLNTLMEVSRSMSLMSILYSRLRTLSTAMTSLQVTHTKTSGGWIRCANVRYAPFMHASRARA